MTQMLLDGSEVLVDGNLDPISPAPVSKGSTPAKTPPKASKPSKATKASKPVVVASKPAQPPVKADKTPKAGKVETTLTPAEKSKREALLKAVTDSIRKETSNIATSYMRIGFQLWTAKERKLYLAADLKNIYEYAEIAFGFKKSSAINFVAVCERFSIKGKDGNPTDKIDPAFALFGYTQLSEMLPLSPEQLADVKPEMTKSEIRSLKADQPAGQTATDDDDDTKPENPTKTVCYDGSVNAQTWDRLLEKLEKTCMGKHIQITIVD